jgi:hypothetical protein
MPHKKYSHKRRPKTQKHRTRKNMIGCSHKRKHFCSKCGKIHSGKCTLMKGGLSTSELAYTGKPIFSVPNPHLAYTGQKVSVGGGDANSIYPVLTETPQGPNRFINPQQGGFCPVCGGGKWKKGGSVQRGGCGCGVQSGGSSGKYPDGLTGSPWTPNGNWPGTNNVAGDFNHYALNTYKVDPQTFMGSEGNTQPWYTGMIGKLNPQGGGKRKHKHRKTHKRGKRAGGLIPQDLVNLGRSILYQGESEANALTGYKAPVNPLPWKDQFGSKYN